MLQGQELRFPHHLHWLVPDEDRSLGDKRPPERMDVQLGPLHTAMGVVRYGDAFADGDVGAYFYAVYRGKVAAPADACPVAHLEDGILTRHRPGSDYRPPSDRNSFAQFNETDTLQLATGEYGRPLAERLETPSHTPGIKMPAHRRQQ